MEEPKKQPQFPKMKSNPLAKYIAFVTIYTLFTLIFSIVMSGISSVRRGIYSSNYIDTINVYNGPLTQNAPNLRSIDLDSKFYIQNKLTEQILKKSIESTLLTKTDGEVVINADFVKKGLSYQPTYKTQFIAKYYLKNSSDTESYIKFLFPFPINSQTNEISNVRLLVDGIEIPNSKAKITPEDAAKDYSSSSQTEGLAWEGKVKPLSESIIEVNYNTVGLSQFKYEGIQNSKGAQDFTFKAIINGTRSYNIPSGLSIDKREFGEEKVTLLWNKPDLYSKPSLSIEVGDKLNPSDQVSRIYLTMTPIYIVFIAITIFLADKFSKKLSIFDLFLISVIYTLYFPLIHYLSSFTIDPTIEIFAKMNVGYFSMPLYLAFLIAWVIGGGLIYYLIGRVTSFKFSTKFIIPTLLLFIGFFPIVVTVPEYSMLMVIIGSLALMLIIIQVRVKLMAVENK